MILLLFILFDKFSFSFFGLLLLIDLLVRYISSKFFTRFFELHSSTLQSKFVCVISFVLLLGKSRDLPHSANDL